MYRCTTMMLLLVMTAACTSAGKYARLPGPLAGDFHNFYSHRNLRATAFVFGAAGMLEHATADEYVRGWYENDVKGRDADRIARPGNFFADEAIIVPVTAGAFAFELFGTGRATTAVGQWGERSLRAYAVGGPVILASRNVFGEPSVGSRWSNCAFVSTVPFATAASMTDHWLLKGAYYAGSAYGAWSSFNNGRQEFSSTVAGWWLANRAAETVSRSEPVSPEWDIVPVLWKGFSGLFLVVRF